MATQTSKLSLTLPEATDSSLVREDFNDNMEIIDAGVQMVDAGLTSIAALTTAANKMIYTTALDTYAVASLTAFARTILDDANEATFKATVNLEIGTNVQAYDASLTSISALTYVSGSYIALTAEDTYAVRTYAQVLSDIGAANSGANSSITSITGLTTPLGAAYGGTGIANAAGETITLTGGFALNLTLSAATGVTLPTSGTLVNSAVATLSSLTSVGTITTGGLGTGAVIAGVTMTLGSDADGDVYYRSSNILTRLPKGTATQVLAMNAGATAPEWVAAGAGYTNLTSFVDQTAFRVFYSDTAGDVTELALGADNTYLMSNGADQAPTFEAAGGGASQLSDLSDVGVTTATDKNALMADGDSWESRALVEADISDLGNYAVSGANADITSLTGLTTPLTFAQGGTGVASWTQYLIPYADTTTSLSQIAIGTDGQVLTSGGAGVAPSFEDATGGASTFLDLTDTPANYTDAASKLVTVNAAANALEYSDILDTDLIKCKNNATTAPTVNDDSDDGYAVNSIISDVTNDKSYICVDATVGAAVWKEISLPSTVALKADKLSVFASTTSAELAGVISDEIGAGKARFDTAVTAKTTTATLNVNEAGTILCSAAGGAYTITLPTASGNTGLTYHFIKTDANYTLITLDGDGTETFNYENSTGAPVLTYARLNTYCAEVTIVSDGANWQVINERLGLVPYCWVYLNADQLDITNTTFIRVDFNTKSFDIGSNFDNSVWVSGNATSTSAGHLVDAGGAFTSTMVNTRVKNTTDSVYTYVTAYNSATDLTVRDDIFVNTEGYEIKNAKFVVPIPGIYQINSLIRYTNTLDAKVWYLSIRYQAAYKYQGIGHSSSTSDVTVIGNIFGTLAIGDTVEAYAYHNAGVNTPDIDGGVVGLTNLIVKLVSKD